VTVNVRPAPIQLAELCRVMRPDWDPDQTAGAIEAARHEWPFPRIAAEVVRLLVQEDSSPRDLTEAARDRYAPRAVADPESTREWIATCRAVVEDARDAKRAADEARGAA
jgi:hypothetical protein